MKTKKRIELTTVEDLIKELQQLPPKSNVYANGTYGYMYIFTHDDETEVTFDDSYLFE